VTQLLTRDNTYLLPAVNSSNIIGAYEMGLTPGLLPGRVPANASQKSTREILEAAVGGNIKVLILSGANVVDHFPDQQLATKALETVDTVIAIDCFVNETTQHADIFLPTTVANEKEGSVTNIEGRVQRVVRIVAPQGNVVDDWKWAYLIAERLGEESTIETEDDITNEISCIASSFAHLTPRVLARARDGAIVPIEDNRDVLVKSMAPAVDVPSWEPIASRAAEDEDPLVELDHEEHHPSANVAYADMIDSPFAHEGSSGSALSTNALRLVFVDSFFRASPRKLNSGALSGVTQSHETFSVRIHPDDIAKHNIDVTQMVKVSTSKANTEIHIVADDAIMPGVMVAVDQPRHPLKALVTAGETTDVVVG
jgi:anaerobic selenocysteine-containing dehydrogenase